MKMKATLSFETSGTTYPVTRHIPEDFNPQQSCCENLKSRTYEERSLLACDTMYSVDRY